MKENWVKEERLVVQIEITVSELKLLYVLEIGDNFAVPKCNTHAHTQIHSLKMWACILWLRQHLIELSPYLYLLNSPFGENQMSRNMKQTLFSLKTR